MSIAPHIAADPSAIDPRAHDCPDLSSYRTPFHLARIPAPEL
jgi:hypothetical protein